MSILFKQAVAVIDGRTTNICLAVAGQIRGLDEPFTTLNGEFDMPPFHVHCRTMVATYMDGFVNEQRAAANEELQNRPFAERDTRGAPTAPHDLSNPPKGAKIQAVKAAAKEVPTPRSTALDLAELTRGWNLTVGKAKATRERLARRSTVHAAVISAITTVLKGGTLSKDAAKRLREVLRDAPLTKTTLWMGVEGKTLAGLEVGGTLANPTVSTFTTSQARAAKARGAAGLIVKMKGGRALPVEAIALSPSKHEWLVGRTLRIVDIRADGEGRWIVIVDNV